MTGADWLLVAAIVALFLVSGVATRFMLRKTAAGALLRSRSSRLLIPLIFGMLVIVPPQAWIQTRCCW